MGKRLPDVVEAVTQKFRVVATLIKHPGAVFKREAWKKGRTWYENTSFPGGESSADSDESAPAPSASSSEDAPTVSQQRFLAVTHSRNLEYGDRPQTPLSEPTQNPATMPLWDEPIEDGRIGEFFEEELGDVGNFDGISANYWQKKVVLLLQPDETLKGSQWYRYTIGQVIRKTDWVRWYGAINQAGDAVVIQEYILRQTDFSPTEIEERQRAFERLISLNIPAINGPGEGRDFRIVRLVEAFAPKIERGSDEAGRCYLVVKPLPSVSLKDYLAQRGSLPSAQIREILKQLLQTLRFLQTACRITFSETQRTAGIPHGNLNLDTLFIRHSPLAGANSDRQFFVHVTDLLLWEHLIYPPSSARYHDQVAQSKSDLGRVEEDLAALGRIGFQLAGGTVDPHTQEVIGLHDAHLWRHLDDSLHDYLCCLIGERTPFKSAESALKTLLNPPPRSAQPVSAQGGEALGLMAGVEDQPEPQPIDSSGESFLSRWWKFLVFLGLLGLGAIAFSFCSRQLSTPMQAKKITPEEAEQHKLKAIPSLSTAVQYRTEDSGAWHTVLNGRSMVGVPYELDETVTPAPLMNEIAARNQFAWVQNSPNFQPRDQVINFIQQKDENIGLIRSSEDLADNPMIKTEAIAHDGLAILVPSTDFHNGGNAPKVFNGKITLDDLKELYTSDSLDDAVLHGQKIDLYFPNDQEAIAIFKEKVLGGEKEKEFTALLLDATERDERALMEKGRNGKNIRNNLYELMLDNYLDNNTEKTQLAIGFDRFSNAFGQCSIYPLAVVQNRKEYQPLKLNNGGVITPETDLCGTKGSYHTNLSQDYPLRYDLVVAYRAGSDYGARVVEMFRSLEAQYLIGEMGLMPFMERSDIYDIVWRQIDDDS